MEYITRSEEETELLGYELGQKAKPGQVVALFGDLGMGKTAFTRGVARGMGIEDRVTSPTFAIVHEYDSGRLPLFHFDLYRLDQSDQLYEIGWEDYLCRSGVCVVEWSERAEELLPEDCLRIRILPGAGEEERKIQIEGMTE